MPALPMPVAGYSSLPYGRSTGSVSARRRVSMPKAAYTYAVLHDPVYRHDYRVDLLREFPRLPLYHDFQHWAAMGRQLLDLHIGFESAEPYPLDRVEPPPRWS